MRRAGCAGSGCARSMRLRQHRVRLTGSPSLSSYHAGVTTGTDRSGLSERDARILDFERTAPSHRGSKERAIWSEFQFSAARYYQLLNSVIDSPAAYADDPLLVGRLRRARGLRTSRITTPAGGDEAR